jgi:hypothetical protein
VPVGEVCGARVPCAACLFWYGEERRVLCRRGPNVAETGDEEGKVVTKCSAVRGDGREKRKRKRKRKRKSLREGRLDGLMWAPLLSRFSLA